MGREEREGGGGGEKRHMKTYRETGKHRDRKTG